MIGIVAGLFCVLVTSGLCSLCFDIDLKWWISLEKPDFVLAGGWYSLLVGICYLSCVLSVSRLVEFRHIFPSMIYFLVLGLFSVLYVYAFFKMKSLVVALADMAIVLASSYILFVRFMMKDYKIAIEFFPTFAFNVYAFVCTLCIFMTN